MRNATLALCALTLLAGCATLGDQEFFSDDLDGQPLKKVSLDVRTLNVDYKTNGKSRTVETFVCASKEFRKTALLLHDETAGFSKDKICSQWTTQAFANKGYNVVAINRPGFGESTGPKDFAGATSQAAIVSAAKKALPKGKKNYDVIWGYSSGAIAAAFVAKKLPGTKMLIIGNGIFDTETLATKATDATLKKEMEMFIAAEGEDGHEDRSIEWDVENLPKHVFLYHSEMNADVPFQRAVSFRTTLATAEYKVDLVPVKEAKLRIDWPKHQSIIRTILVKTEKKK